MTEMVERVARAIFEECNRQSPVSGMGYADADDGKTILDGAYDLADLARAAILAMREPTDAMVKAAQKTNTSEVALEKWIFQTMIDAALAEPQP